MKRILLILISIILISSCEKKTEEESNPTIDLSLLENKTWVISNATVEPAVTHYTVFEQPITTDDLWNMVYEPCDKDNTVVFNADGSYRSDSHTLCDYETEAIETGTWRYDQELNSIILKKGGFEYGMEVVELTYSTLIVDQSLIWNGIEHTQTTTWKKQD